MNKFKVITKSAIRKFTDITFWKNAPHNSFVISKDFIQSLVEFSSFFVLLIVFVVSKLFSFINFLPFGKNIYSLIYKFWSLKAKKILEKIIIRLDTSSASSVKRSYLISLSYKNLMSKKTRTFVTILGMSIGVGVIVLLLSLGYGVERLIIGRIARLDELKMVDIATGANTALRLDGKLIDKIRSIKEINEIMPLVSFIGKVDFNDAKTDVLVYSIPESYLKSTSARLLRGKYFSSKVSELPRDTDVAGARDEIINGKLNEPVNKNLIHFIINPGKKTYAREDCTSDSKIVGIVRNVEGGLSGFEYWGDIYLTQGKREGLDKDKNLSLQKWVKSEVPIFYETYDGSFLPKLGDNGRQVWSNVCIQKNEIVIQSENVLGDSTSAVLTTETNASESADLNIVADESASDSASIAGDIVIATDEAGMEIVSFATQTNAKKQEIINFGRNATYEAVVSNGLLTLLNIPLNKALDTSFKTAFVLTKSIVPSIEGKATTEEKQFRIVGVIDDDESAYFYVPLDNASALNIKNYSQLKIVLGSKDSLVNVRKQVEVLGFRTSSAADTVTQIESLFASLRVLLVLIGLVALGVASLGMFNTLTVSLLERTREIGGMKTIGMVSKEVRDLFLAEAMILGMAGGFGGLVLGFIAGKTLSLIISVVALSNGEGILDLTYIPWFLIVIIVISSFLVGIVTGYYPARRAKRISALNALRYE